MTIYCLKCNGEGYTHMIEYKNWVLSLADFTCKKTELSISSTVVYLGKFIVIVFTLFAILQLISSVTHTIFKLM